MEDKTSKQKKGVRRTAKASGSPIPYGPTGGAMDDMPSACGHMNCTGGKCGVRYVGPTTPIRDHHVVHAMRSSSHVWSAAIVTGLAVVLTGALGYAVVAADAANQPNSMYGEFQQINNRLDRIEGMVKKLLDRCESGTCGQAGQKAEQPPTGDQCVAGCQKEYGDNLEKANACVQERCGQKTAEQPVADTCTLECKDKYKDDAAAINKCLIENKCPGAPLPAPVGTAGNTATGLTTGGATTTGGVAAPTNVEICLKKCSSDRAVCFRGAGSNYKLLTECLDKEATCKKACSAK